MKKIKTPNSYLENFSESEKQALDKLIQAAEIIGEIYEKQKGPRKKEANFYPEGATKEEIKRAAEKNPKILHPYTFVKKDKKGKLKPVFFTVEFRKELKTASDLIKKAAKFIKDKSLAEYLRGQAKALLSNKYALNEILWITAPSYKINFIIGPIERYLDHLFFKKCAYQSWVGVIDEERTKEAKRFEEIILASRRKILSGTSKIKLPSLKVEVINDICFQGLIAETMFTGTNLPNDTQLMEKYGSKLILFESSLDTKFEQGQIPIFNSIFLKKVQKTYSGQELYNASLRCILLHEISHSLIRYKDAEKRLENLFPVFDEILAYVLGVKCCSSLLLKGVISSKELEAILLMHLVRHFNWRIDFKSNPDVKKYAQGAAIAINFYIEDGSIRKKNKKLEVNFTKLFMSIGHLSQVLEYYLASGTYEEAKEFVDNYGSFKTMDSFHINLK